MNRQEKINRGFFTAILYSFKDLDKSISEQIRVRDRESQLLPLVYFTCLILLLSQLIQVTSQVQKAPYLSVITAVIVSYLFFLPIFMYITSFILHFVLQFFGSISSSFGIRLALFWSLTISANIILLRSITQIFLNGLIELFIVIASEIIIIYIFSRMISFVSCFWDRHLFTLIVTSFYFAQLMFVYS